MKKAKLKVTCCHLQNGVKNCFLNNVNQAYHARNKDAIVECTTTIHKNINSAWIFSLASKFKMTTTFQMQKLEKPHLLSGKYGIWKNVTMHRKSVHEETNTKFKYSQNNTSSILASPEPVRR
jgi:hypothetical protein